MADCGPPYSSWAIGVTDDPIECKSTHEREKHIVSRWRHWDAGTENDARKIARYLQCKEMLGGPGGPGGPGSARYVYVM